MSFNLKATAKVTLTLDGTKLRGLNGSELVSVITKTMGDLDIVVNPKLNPLREFPYCSSDLKMIPVFGSWKTVRVICEGKEVWDTNVRTNLIDIEDSDHAHQGGPFSGLSGQDKKKSMVVKLKKDLESGQKISASDVELVGTDKFVSKSYITDISKVIGRKLKLSMKMGKMIKDRNLVPDWAISKQQSRKNIR